MEADLQIIQSKIIEIRGNRVLPDFHLAELYGVETRGSNKPYDGIWSVSPKILCFN